MTQDALDQQGCRIVARRETPLSFITICSCGWRHSESRRQNALARTAKTKAAFRVHMRLRQREVTP